MISLDKKADLILSKTENDINSLSKDKNIFLGYVTMLRLLPSYISFAQSNPDFGNSDLAQEIAATLRSAALGEKLPSQIEDSINLLNEKFVPDMDDFGSESKALEAALSLIFLFKYIQSSEISHIYEIFRGIIECILMSEEISEVHRQLSNEQNLQNSQIQLISSAEHLNITLLKQCISLN